MISRAFPAKSWCKKHNLVHPAQAPVASAGHASKVPGTREALHCLHMSCSAYYFDRAARGIGIPAEVSVQLLVMSQAIYDGRNHGTVLSNSIDFFGRTSASIENVDMREALRVARIALQAALADTQTELPIVSVKPADPSGWLL